MYFDLILQPELHVPEEPTISYNNLALENSESEPEQESGDVEMNEMAANKSEEKQLHDIDLSWTNVCVYFINTKF